jgi:hypothetical protein
MSNLTVTFKDEVKSIQNPVRVIMHVKAQDAANISKFSLDQIQAGEDLRVQVAQAYDMSKVYLNYRAKFIAVKVDSAKFANKASEAAELIDRLCADKGYDKVFQGDNIIFHIPL